MKKDRKTLTPKEYECFCHMIHGVNLGKISEFMGLSIRTVQDYVIGIKKKIGLRHKKGILRWGIDAGIIKINKARLLEIPHKKALKNKPTYKKIVTVEELLEIHPSLSQMCIYSMIMNSQTNGMLEFLSKNDDGEVLIEAAEFARWVKCSKLKDG
jgi:DNA-binding CsgD family transcriptional regulator